jgi:hypothetical protein
MSVERVIRIIAGTFILLSLALGIEGSPIYVSTWFLAFTAFVGFNLLQSGFTRFCPMETFLKMGGVKEGGACCGGNDKKGGCC